MLEGSFMASPSSAESAACAATGGSRSRPRFLLSMAAAHDDDDDDDMDWFVDDDMGDGNPPCDAEGERPADVAGNGAVLSEADLRRQQEHDIVETCAVLSVPRAAACFPEVRKTTAVTATGGTASSSSPSTAHPSPAADVVVFFGVDSLGHHQLPKPPSPPSSSAHRPLLRRRRCPPPSSQAANAASNITLTS